MAIYIGASAIVIFAALIVDFNILCTEGCLEEQYIGCYQDTSTASSRSNWTTGFTDSSTLSIELCIETCEQHGKTYAILQNGRNCQCGDVLNFNLSDASCKTRCSGNDRQVCGGSSGSTSPYVIYSVCPIGFYGVGCGEICHCKQRIPCNLKSGFCPTGCEDNWTLDTCSKAKPQSLRDRNIGCYGDENTRAMEYEFGFITTPNALEKCSSICAIRSYTYTGMEVGKHCFCGKSYERYGPLNDFRCNFTCDGDVNQPCGGHWALSVYYACPTGYFGLGCMSRCNYAVKQSCFCNSSSCSSRCKSGWMGRRCDIRNCSDNNGDCAVNERCVTVDLKYSSINRCNCKAGYQRNQLWDSCTGFPENESSETQEPFPRNEEPENSVGTLVGVASVSAIVSIVIFALILIVVVLCRRRLRTKNNRPRPICSDVSYINHRDHTDGTYENQLQNLNYETLRHSPQPDDSAYSALRIERTKGK